MILSLDSLDPLDDGLMSIWLCHLRLKSRATHRHGITSSDRVTTTDQKELDAFEGKLIKMQNLHAPTIPSGPVSTSLHGSTTYGSLTIAQLQGKKDALEAELKALGGVLDSVSAMCERRLDN